MGIPLFELRVDDPVRESLPTDTDTLKHTVTLELVEDKVGIDHTRLFQLVGDDAAHKVGVGGVQGLHQLVQGFLKTGV